MAKKPTKSGKPAAETPATPEIEPTDVNQPAAVDVADQTNEDPPAQDSIPSGDAPAGDTGEAPALDPGTVAALQEDVKPGDTIVVGNEADGSDGVPVVVEKIDGDGIHVTDASAEALAAQDDAANSGAPVGYQPKPGTIDAVMRALPDKAVCGAVLTRPDTILSGELAELQNRIYLVLVDQGVTLRSQGDVYGWLLRSVADAL